MYPSGRPADHEKRRMYTWTEVRRHNTPTSCWIVVDGDVYDVTCWLGKHPGGQIVILNSAGMDCTDIFNAYHPREMRDKSISYYRIGKLADYSISPITRDFRSLAKSIEGSPLMEGRISFYVKLVLWYLALLSSSIACVLFFPENQWVSVVLGGFLMALYFQQVAFIGHDLGHTAVFHNRRWDMATGLFFGNMMTGISLGWWKASHNAHHVTTNSCADDPDIQHLPIFAVSAKFFDSIFSSYHEKTLRFDRLAQWLVPIQAKLYYLAMALARCNLYVQSWLFLLRGEEYMRKRLHTHRRNEMLGLAFFATWYAYLVSCLPTWSGRVLFFLLSHGLAGLLHVQITLSHFAMPVSYDSHPLETESFLEHQLKTCLDIDCSSRMDWFHGGLQFQTVHHLFPRVPRSNLRRLRSLIEPFCLEHGLEYSSMGFVEANIRMISHLQNISDEYRQKAFTDFLNMEG